MTTQRTAAPDSTSGHRHFENLYGHIRAYVRYTKWPHQVDHACADSRIQPEHAYGQVSAEGLTLHIQCMATPLTSPGDHLEGTGEMQQAQYLVGKLHQHQGCPPLHTPTSPSWRMQLYIHDTQAEAQDRLGPSFCTQHMCVP